MGPAESARAFAALRRAHDRVPQRALWADVETFAWEGPANQQTSPLIPAPWERVRAQLEAVSPRVDTILIYQYQGLMNRPGSPAFAGHPDSTRVVPRLRALVEGQPHETARLIHRGRSRSLRRRRVRTRFAFGFAPADVYRRLLVNAESLKPDASTDALPGRHPTFQRSLRSTPSPATALAAVLACNTTAFWLQARHFQR
jgi:hypothetical protein